MIVPAIIAMMFLSLFAAFGRADIGLVVVGVFFVPLILFAWLGYRTLERRAAGYLAERARFDRAHLLLDSQHVRERRLHIIEQRHPRLRIEVLSDVANGQPGGAQNLTVIGVFLFQEQTKKRPSSPRHCGRQARLSRPDCAAT